MAKTNPDEVTSLMMTTARSSASTFACVGCGIAGLNRLLRHLGNWVVGDDQGVLGQDEGTNREAG